MSLIQIQREMDAAFRHGDVAEYERLLTLFNMVRLGKINGKTS